MLDETSILIDSVRDAEGSMDEKCHDIFLNKEILAPILKQTIEEYSDLTVEEIQSLIDEASISKVETVSEYPVSKDVKIKPLDTALNQYLIRQFTLMCSLRLHYRKISKQRRVFSYM